MSEVDAKHAPLASTAPELVPARMVNEVLYCERLMYLEWAQGEFADNVYTVDGRSVHRRTDQPGGKSKAKRDGQGDDDPTMDARSVWLSSEELGLTAKIDLIDEDAGSAVPVEYKRGRQPDIAERAYLPERAQLCAQALLLRDHGYQCEHGVIYFAADRKRVEIPITDELVETTKRATTRARELAGAGVIPPPLVDSPKCDGCSLSGICLPDEVTALETKARTPTEDEDRAEPAVRRLHPARDDRLPLYVQEHSARIGLKGDCLVVKRLEGEDREVKLYDTSQVSIFGNAQLTTQAMRRLMQEGISVSFFSTGGKLLGRATGLASNNIELRVAQYAAARDPAFCLGIARQLVVSKIRNSRTFLRRNHEDLNPGTLDGLKQLARKASEAEGLDSLLGIEGSAARLYFSEFAGLLSAEENPGFDFHGRNRRPPRDPVNAMLSFAYALLTKDLVNAVAHTGLDPLLGYFHQPRFGRPALALDLMEEFRPLVADSVVVGAINNGIVQERDFHRTPAGVSIKAPARKRFIEAYERRMDQLVTHPVFGYRISYRRVLEVQARLLGRVLLGELEEYPTFQTR